MLHNLFIDTYFNWGMRRNTADTQQLARPFFRPAPHQLQGAAKPLPARVNRLGRFATKLQQSLTFKGCPSFTQNGNPWYLAAVDSLTGATPGLNIMHLLIVIHLR